MPEQKLIPVTIDGNSWYRGKGTEESALKRGSDGKMCCLGFCCLAVGIPEVDITDRGMPFAINDAVEYADKLGKMVYLETVFPGRKYAHSSSLAMQAADINDNPTINDKRRVERLSPVLRELGFDPTFINIDQPSLDSQGR